MATNHKALRKPKVVDAGQVIKERLGALEGAELIDAINDLREIIHAYSPFKSEPTDFVRWVPNTAVYANQYNPNSVAPPEMELLRLSIDADGYCMEQSTPVLCADLVWRSAGSLEAGQEIIAFDENPLCADGDKTGRRNYRTATVTFNELRESPLVKVVTEKDEVLCTPNHPWLVRRNYGPMAARGTQWVEARDLRETDLALKLFDVWEFENSHASGWLAGFLDGEGTMSVNLTRNGSSNYRLAGYQRPSATADKMLAEMSARVAVKVFQVDRTKDNPKWSDMVMCRVDRMGEIMKLLGTVRPERLIADGAHFWEGRSIEAPGTPTKVIRVEPADNGIIASLATSERTYIAGGYAMHNTQPIVAMPDDKGGYEVVDGFHRHRVGKEMPSIQKRVHGYLPLVCIRSTQMDQSDRMASTIRHNRARGKHSVQAMSDIVIELKKRNWTDAKIASNLGMDADEVLRLCQISGLAEVFADSDFSQSWDVDGEVSALDFEDCDDVVVRTSNTSDPLRIFHPYEKWECYAAGFYETGWPGRGKEECEAMYGNFLRDDEAFRAALEGVIAEWVHSCEHYLTNSAMNRIAYLGQAAAAYAHGLPSVYCGGFQILSEPEKDRANATALEYLNRWLVSRGRDPVTMEAANPGRQSDIY